MCPNPQRVRWKKTLKEHTKAGGEHYLDVLHLLCGEAVLSLEKPALSVPRVRSHSPPDGGDDDLGRSCPVSLPAVNDCPAWRGPGPRSFDANPQHIMRLGTLPGLPAKGCGTAIESR